MHLFRPQAYASALFQAALGLPWPGAWRLLLLTPCESNQVNRFRGIVCAESIRLHEKAFQRAGGKLGFTLLELQAKGISELSYSCPALK